MHARFLLAAALVTLVSLPLLADSIDDAEAKRRGVPVAQVQAENALAKERLKTAALEKQIADLQKQRADGGAAPSLPTPTPPAIPASTKVVPIPTKVAPVATAPSAKQASDIDAPRESSPLYDGLVERYLVGDWTTLAADLTAKQKEIAALPAGNRDDLAYIRQTVAECRPAWWDQVKKGKSGQFTQAIWNQSITVSYSPADEHAFEGSTRVNGVLVHRLKWPSADMDSKDPIPMKYQEFIVHGTTELTCGDGANRDIWTILALAQFMQQNDTGTALPAPESDQYLRAQVFWEALTAGYYGTPPVRRLCLMSGTAGLDPNNVIKPAWASRRPLASAFLIELKTHWDRYKSISSQAGKFHVITDDDKVEFYAAYNNILAYVPRTKFSLAEDRHLREFFRQLAAANSNWKNSFILLPNKQSIELNPAKDQQNERKRVEFLRSDIGNAQTKP